MKVREVLAWTLPEVDLPLCQSINKEVTSVEDFMAKLREAVQQEANMELQARATLCVAAVAAPLQLAAG